VRERNFSSKKLSRQDSESTKENFSPEMRTEKEHLKKYFLSKRYSRKRYGWSSYEL